MILVVVVIALGFVWMAGADIIELDLFTISCNGTYDYDSQYWASYFDLGVNFTEISHVYVYIILVIGIITTVWLSVGGIIDIRNMFTTLRTIKWTTVPLSTTISVGKSL